MKTHDTFLELAAAAVDYPLTPSERSRLDRHLAACPACVRSSAAMRADALVLADMPAVFLPDRRGAEILAAALHPHGVRHPVRMIAIVALLGLLLVGSIAAGAEILRRSDADLGVVLPAPSPSAVPGPTPVPTPQPAPSASALPGPGRLLITRGTSSGSFIELVMPDGSTTRLAEGRDPAWSADGRVLYTCGISSSGPTSVCMLESAAPDTGATLMTESDRPVVTPDGRALVVHRGMIDVGATWRIVLDSDVAGLVHAGDFRQWSPDGGWLAGQPESTTAQVAIVRADGSEFRVLATGYDPTWSPSGDRLAYWVVEGNAASLRAVNVATGAAELLYTAPDGATATGPAWLADGGLVFVLDGDLWRLPPGSSSPTQLTTGFQIDGDRPVVSPDGAWIAFTATGADGEPRVGLSTTDGTDVRMLDLGGPASQPVWAPEPGGQPEPSPGADTTLGDRWTQATTPVVVGRPVGPIEAVTAGGPGFVGVGLGCTGDVPTCEIVVWTSRDGSAWERVPASPALSVAARFLTSGPSVGAFDVAAGEPGIVAIGYSAQHLDGAPMQATAWFSPDGFTWQRTELGSAERSRVRAVTWDGRSFVVVGEDRIDRPTSLADFANAKARAAVWTSPDGRTWTRVPHTTALEAGGFVDTTEDPVSGGMSDVVAGPGGLVAVGSTCRPQPAGCMPAAWTSSNGTTWARADGMPEISGFLAAVAPVPTSASAYVAVGAETCGSSPVAVPGGCPALVLTSADGRTWAHQSFDQEGQLDAVVPIGGQLFAAASRGPDMLWATVDGSAWIPAEVAPATAAGAAGGMGAWHCAADGAAPATAVCIATSSETNESVAWVSRSSSGR